MKKLCMILASAMLVCLLAACGGASSSSVSDAAELAEPVQSTAEPAQSTAKGAQTCTLYAVFSGGEVKEYSVESAGAPITAEELAHQLSELTGLDFRITAGKVEDGWRIDWAADSTLIAGLDDREQKEEFFFFDHDTLSWFMMDSLCRTLTENLNAENIYYTMDGGQELALAKLSPATTIPSDIPYLGSEFYLAHSDVKGDDEILFARTKGLWRLDGDKDAASIEMNGSGGFTMYYASGSVEAAGYLECVDEYNDGNFRYDCYTADGKWITGFFFDSDTQIHFGNDDDRVYLLSMPAAYLGCWEYPNGWILEITSRGWSLYETDHSLMMDGPVDYDEEAAYLMNADGSSGGGKVYFNADGDLIDFGDVLTYLGESFSDLFDDAPKG